MAGTSGEQSPTGTVVIDATAVPDRPERARGLSVVSVTFLALAAFAVFVLVLGAMAARAASDAALHAWLHEAGPFGLGPRPPGPAHGRHRPPE